MKLECLSKLPFGMYAEMERNGINLNEIDTTDCENSLLSLQELSRKMGTKNGVVGEPVTGGAAAGYPHHWEVDEVTDEDSEESSPKRAKLEHQVAVAAVRPPVELSRERSTSLSLPVVERTSPLREELEAARRQQVPVGVTLAHADRSLSQSAATVIEPRVNAHHSINHTGGNSFITPPPAQAQQPHPSAPQSNFASTRSNTCHLCGQGKSRLAGGTR